MSENKHDWFLKHPLTDPGLENSTVSLDLRVSDANPLTEAGKSSSMRCCTFGDQNFGAYYKKKKKRKETESKPQEMRTNYADQGSAISPVEKRTSRNTHINTWVWSLLRFFLQSCKRSGRFWSFRVTNVEPKTDKHQSSPRPNPVTCLLTTERSLKARYF